MMRFGRCDIIWPTGRPHYYSLPLHRAISIFPGRIEVRIPCPYNIIHVQNIICTHVTCRHLPKSRPLGGANLERTTRASNYFPRQPLSFFIRIL